MNRLCRIFATANCLTEQEVENSYESLAKNIKNLFEIIMDSIVCYCVYIF